MAGAAGSDAPSSRPRQRVERRVDVGLGVVDVPRRRAAARRARPRRSRPPRAARGRPATSAETIAESDGSSPRPGAEAVREPDVVRVDRLDADRVDELQRGLRADPREPRRRAVEAARGRRRGAAAGRSTRRATSSPANQPAAAGTIALEALGPHGHERGAARRHQPLVGVADDDVEARRVERQPAAAPASRRRRVIAPCAAAAAAIASRSATSPVAICTALNGDDVRARVDRVRRARRARTSRTVDAAVLLGHEREEHRGEVDVRREHPRAVGQRGGDEADELGDRRAGRDGLGRDADERREARRARRSSPRPSAPSSCARRASRRAPPAAPPTRSRAAARSSRC